MSEPEKVTCYACNGSGRVRMTTAMFSPETFCPRCYGQGYTPRHVSPPAPPKKCPKCDELQAENSKLKRALAGAIPWIGEPSTGPNWATIDARKRNYEMCSKALDDACDCFPEG